MVEDPTAGAVAQGNAFLELLRQRLVRNVIVPAPVAGAEWNVSVPAGVAWELLAAFYSFAASATVANRNPTLRFRDPDGNMYARMSFGGVIAAGAVGAFSWLVGYGSIIAGSSPGLPLPTPPIPLPAGHQIGSLTSSLDAGDQFSGIILTVREWSPNAVLTASEWLEDHAR